MLWFAAADDVSVSVNFVGFWAIVVSALIGAVLLSLATLRLLRPLKAPARDG